MRLYIMIGVWFAALLVVYFITTQITWPLLRGTALFPYFRRERELVEEIVEARQERREDALERRLEEERRLLDAEDEEIIQPTDKDPK
jgi:hypothetical protein